MRKRNNRAKETFPEKILREATQRGYRDLLVQSRLIVAVSGGADSLALLHSLLALRGEHSAQQSLHIAHLEHGFRGAEGEADAQFVATVAREHGLKYTIQHVDVPALASNLHISLEDAARRARYTFLATLASQYDATVAVAHTADDQAETVLMSILRGSGLAGIAGMQPLAELRFSPCIEGTPNAKDAATIGVQVFRPLLSIWRDEVEAYCRELGLTARTDSTNAEQIYLRNRVRLDLLPYLQSHYSSAIKEHLVILADIASGEEDLLDQYATEAWQSVVTSSQAGSALYIDALRFSGLHIAMQRRLVRRAIGEIAGTLDGISFQHVVSVVDALFSVTGNVPRFHLPHNVEVEVIGGQGILRSRSNDSAATYEGIPSGVNWPLIDTEAKIQLIAQEIAFMNGWLLSTEVLPVNQLVDAPADFVAHFDLSALSSLAPLVLRPRLSGDTIQPLGMIGRKSLHDLYIDAKIPRLLRDHIPVLTRQDTNDVLWVPGPGGRRSTQALIGPESTHVFRMVFTRNLQS